MKLALSRPAIDKVIYNFKGPSPLQIDVVPIASRLLTPINKTRTTAPHRTDFYRIIWFQQGNPVHTVDFEKIKIISPALLFVHKDKIHKFDREATHDGKVLIFTDTFFLRSDTDSKYLSNSRLFNEFDKPVLLLGMDAHLATLFTMIEQEIAKKGEPLQSESLFHLLHTFLYAAERIASVRFPKIYHHSPASILVNAFLELLEKNYRKRISVEKYASLLNVNANKLNLAVLEIKGKTGKQLVTERLLLEAKRLLIHSTLSLKEIGYELGFKESTNFVKMFHNNVKQTPLAFQKSNR